MFNHSIAPSWLKHCVSPALMICVMFIISAPTLAAGCQPYPACQPKFKFYGYDRGNQVSINTCKTTDSQSPCAWADVTMQSSNYLACKLETTGPIALCYYSGVPGAPLYTPSCVFSQDKNAAQCSCYEISKNKPAGATYSYVLLNAILNKSVYDQTVAACGTDGSKCLNASNMTGNLPEAPVCFSIKNKTLVPGADLYSDFSPILAGTKGLSQYSCPTTGNGNLYAGCMTSPCKKTGKTDPTTGLPLVDCTCPTYNGPNQVGNPQISKGGYSCSPDPFVWSSAYTPPTQPTVP